MEFPNVSSPHVPVANSVGRIMRRVLYALVPAILTLFWFFGWSVFIHLIFASVVALIAEAAMLALRGQPLRLYLGDGSALVTAWLLAVALPPLSPWWLMALGVGLAIILAKHLYGGLGYNPFNPAMVGYVILLISFPLEMSTWLTAQGGLSHSLGFVDTIRVIFIDDLPPGISLDGLTGATTLDSVKTQLGMGLSMTEITTLSNSGLLASWEWVNLAFLLGGLWLIYTRTAAWQIPVGMLVSLALISGFFYTLDPQSHASPWFHLFNGATMIGAFFIATDPVSASTTPRGRLIYGAGIGLLTYIIRSYGGYPDGIGFAILLMNITAPTIDYYTQPRVFGARRS